MDIHERARTHGDVSLKARLKWDTEQAIELAIGRFPTDGPAAYRYVAEIIAEQADR